MALISMFEGRGAKQTSRLRHAEHREAEADDEFWHAVDSGLVFEDRTR